MELSALFPELALLSSWALPLLLLRIVAAMILGGLIGLERERNHAAGFRTHILVCTGVALVMVLSECLLYRFENQEAMRLGAGVISCIGFIGGGSILSDRGKVRGLTTAAGVLATACVGLAVGAGYFLIATVATACILFTMKILNRVSKSRHTPPSEIPKED